MMQRINEIGYLTNYVLNKAIILQKCYMIINFASKNTDKNLLNLRNFKIQIFIPFPSVVF